MRRMILTSLVLLPVLARAQASTATEPKPSTSSANLHAELTKPARATVYAMAGATPAATSTAALPTTTIAPAAFREIVHTQMTDDFADTALRQGWNSPVRDVRWWHANRVDCTHPDPGGRDRPVATGVGGRARGDECYSSRHRGCLRLSAQPRGSPVGRRVAGQKGAGSGEPVPLQAC